MRSIIRLIAVLCIAGVLCGSHRALAVTVALTTTSDTGATDEDKQLIGNLLALMEVEAGRHPHLEIVERQQLDLALHELVLSTSRSDAANLQLGKLAGADLILTAKLLELDESGARHVHVRVTEAQIAVVRGETFVPTSAKQIEETAAEIVDYLASVTKGPEQRAATIAILPFESVEPFDRLRPLERGLRDLFTSFWLRQENFRVVQRTSMDQLLNELELVRRGLSRNGQGLERAPAREAVYVLRGEIDERTSAEGNLVMIRAELVDAQSRRVVASVERATKPVAVADAVTEIAAELSQSVANDTGQAAAVKDSSAKEIDRLYQLALRDVFRFVRYLPDDAGYIPFLIPGVERPRNMLAEVDPNSPLGAALLQKSVDRLESVLFIEPERLTAALPLAYCLSFHVDGVWRPPQCEALLRRVRDESNDPLMQEVAVRLLGDMYFTHKGCLYSEREVSEMTPEDARLGFDRRLEACVSLANIGRGDRIPHMLEMLEKLCKCCGNDERWAALLHTVEKVVEHPNTAKLIPEVQENLASKASAIAAQVLRSAQTSASLKKQADDLLRHWNKSGDRWRWLHAARQLIILNLGGLSYDQFNARLDELFGDVETPFEQQCLTEQKTWLAIRLRNENEVEKALRVLESFQPKNQTGALGYDFTYCHYGYQLGRCYEDLGRKQEAIAAYLHYAELPSGYYHGQDFMQRIGDLGGVPLRADREIDVRYAEWSSGKPLYCRVLATDGKRLYCAGGFEHDGGGPQAVPIKSVQTLDLATGEWTTLGGPNDRVSCLAVADDQLWAGTDRQGLWRMAIGTGKWRRWTTKDGLPTDSVVTIAADGPTAYASVGNIDSSEQVISGGMVRVRDDGVHIYRDNDAPLTAPESIAIDGRWLIAPGTQNRLHALDLKSDKWSTPPTVSSQLVAIGLSGLWTAPRNRIATLVDGEFKTLKSFPAVPLLPDFHAHMYRPKFFLEHDGSLWIGGQPWRRFGDSGLFRLDLTTGRLARYGPRDGFHYDDNNSYTCYAGVWTVGRLWAATSFGLVEVAVLPDEEETHAEAPGMRTDVR